MVASIYQQYDGYPDGVGMELAEFLALKTVINGFGVESMETHANGAGCLAAQYIKEFKTGIGGFYMTSKEDTQEYNYKVVVGRGGKVNLELPGEDFVGTPEEFMEKFGGIG